MFGVGVLVVLGTILILGNEQADKTISAMLSNTDLTVVFISFISPFSNFVFRRLLSPQIIDILTGGLKP
jgi:hypothetical protein